MICDIISQHQTKGSKRKWAAAHFSLLCNRIKGESAQEALCTFGLRVVEEVRRGRFLHNTTIVQKQHPAGN